MAGYSASDDEMDTEESESIRSMLLEISRMIGNSLGKKRTLSSAGHSSTTTTTTTTASDDEGICFLRWPWRVFFTHSMPLNLSDSLSDSLASMRFASRLSDSLSDSRVV